MELEAKGKRGRASGNSSFTFGDRLSSLPDCLIHHIMSFMKARQVVQTCVLSTRWKHLWLSVPSLNIDLEEFKTEGLNRAYEEEWQKFEDFTDHLLIPNNISIALLDTFQLHAHHRGKEAARWIRHGIKYSTQESGIRPQGLSSTPWRLKRLHLSNIHLDDSFVKHISLGCQNLEDLELKGCVCNFHEITSHTLKNLILKDCSCDVLFAITSQTLKRMVISGCTYDSTDCLLVIMAPAVSYLLLSVDIFHFEGGIVLNEMPSIVKASIHLVHCNYPSKLSDDQFNLLDSVSKVTSLHLSYYKAMVLTEEFPQFENLKTLLLEKCDLSDNFQTLGCFLQSSPSLEKLTLRHCKFSKDPKKKKGKVKLDKLSLNQLDVQCKNLKHTEIIYKDDDVHKLVELLLNIAGSLPQNNIKLTKVDSP